jgi:hypothetical protein
LSESTQATLKQRLLAKRRPAEVAAEAMVAAVEAVAEVVDAVANKAAAVAAEEGGVKRTGCGGGSGGVADIAGGAGELSFELHIRHGVPCLLVDPKYVGLSARQIGTWRNLRRKGVMAGEDSPEYIAW